MGSKKIVRMDKFERLKIVASEYLKGTPVAQIAKMCGVSRQMIYNDLNSEEIKATIDKARQQTIEAVGDKIAVQSEYCVDELLRTAINTEDEKLKTTILCYLLDHAIGKPTAKVDMKQTTTENKVVDIDAMLKEIEADNAITIENKDIKTVKTKSN